MVVIASPQSNITYSIAGTSVHGCKGYGNVTVEVFPTPSSSLNNEVYICIDEFIILNPGDFDEQHWFLWSNGSTEQKITIENTGIYWVRISNPGCSIIDTTIVKQGTEVWVPNSFTPDGNYVNDVFKAEASTEFEEFHMIVFNRWGQRIFESNNVHEGWDGTYNGKFCQQEVYVWIIEYFTPGKERKTIKGTVTLMR